MHCSDLRLSKRYTAVHDGRWHQAPGSSLVKQSLRVGPGGTPHLHEAVKKQHGFKSVQWTAHSFLLGKGMMNSLCLVSIRFNNSQFNEHWNKHSYAEVQKKTKKYFSRMEVLLVLWYMHYPYRSDQNTVCKCWLTSNAGSQHALFPKNKECHSLWVAILSLSQKSSWYSLLCWHKHNTQSL